MATHQQLIQRHQSRVPPGFRFHPTDEELVGYYLHKKVSARRIDLDVIREIDLYKMEPWDLQEKCRIGSVDQSEWYFFSQKDKKYPTGTRTNRATTAGFWKATGRDKMIHTKYSFVGMRKTLVFYKGRAPHGQKTDWIMHEYRLEDEKACNNNTTNYNMHSDQDESHWVVCRVFKKKINLKGQRMYEPSPELDVDESALQQEVFSFPSSKNNRQSSNSNSYQMTMASTMVSPCCKQDIPHLETMPSSVFNDPFSRLPQLESPTISSSSGSPPIFNAGLTTTNNIRNTLPAAFMLEPEQQNNRISQVQAFLDDQLMMTDWRAFDKVARHQLSQEQLLKESTLRHCTESDDYTGALTKHGKQDLDEADLWNFTS